MTEPSLALLLDDRDSVATLLTDTNTGAAVSLKGTSTIITTHDAIAYGHKIAIKDIADGDPILKYGQKIGKATKTILRGEWIHLHNMCSDVDLSFSERIDTCSKKS